MRWPRPQTPSIRRPQRTRSCASSPSARAGCSGYWTTGWPRALAATALLTLVVVATQAAAIGSMIPVLLARLGCDPAVATGVFITTSNDVIGVLVYFLVATTLYL